MEEVLQLKNRRTQRIDAAIKQAKIRDGFKCRVCGLRSEDGNIMEGAHILPRNVAFPWYHADDPKWIITLCSRHHKLFGINHSPERLAKWLQFHGLLKEANQIKMGMNGELHGD